MMSDELEIWELTDEELPEALRLSTQAGWNQTLDDWKRVLSLGPCLGGRIRGRLVATGTLVAHDECGWLGMLLVDEQLRNRGYGSRMLDLLLKGADDRLKLQWVGLDATDLGRPIYLKRGFRDVGKINRWAICPKIVPQTFTVREFVNPVDVPFIEELDREAGGQGVVWAVAVGSDFVVCNDNEQNIGFGISRRGRLGQYFGPIVARSVDAGASMISGFMKAVSSQTVTQVCLDVPEGNPLERWLTTHGFNIVRHWTRMIRGMTAYSISPLVFAIPGPELG
jgi:GNAT superfamily N-acetyltransferase